MSLFVPLDVDYADDEPRWDLAGLDEDYFAFDPLHGAMPLPRGRDPMPFELLPEEKRWEIALLVLRPRPPDQWIDLGAAQIRSRAWYEWHWHRGIDPERTTKDSRRIPLQPWERQRIIARDGLVCGLCRGPVELADVHIDHIIPVALGGGNDPENLQVAHSRCNLTKGARG